MAKEKINLSVVLHANNDYNDWIVEIKERFLNHRLRASYAVNNYLLDFYWKLGRDIEAKQYANTYGSGFYRNLSQDLKNEMPGTRGFSPTNLKYMSYFYKLYAPLLTNSSSLADDFAEGVSGIDNLQVAESCQNRQQSADDFKMLFSIPWDHHCRIISRCNGDMEKALLCSSSCLCCHRIENADIPSFILGTTEFLCLGNQPSIQNGNRQSYYWFVNM